MCFRNQVMIFPSQNDCPWVTAITVTGKGDFEFALFEGFFDALILVLLKVHFYLKSSIIPKFV